MLQLTHGVIRPLFCKRQRRGYWVTGGDAAKPWCYNRRVEDRAQAPAEITQLLREWRDGNTEAFHKVVEHVYADLRRRAATYLRTEGPENTLQSAGLVHEAFIKLHAKRAIDIKDRNHFYALAAQAMRRILVDHARHRGREKRGGGLQEIPLEEELNVAAESPAVDLSALDEALSALAAFDSRQASVVELKYFGGLTLEEIADVLGVSPVTVKRDWRIARAWLRSIMM